MICLREVKKMKKSKKVWFICNYIEGLILLTAGILAIVYNDNETLQKVLAYVVGAFVIIDGLLRIVMVLWGEKTSQDSIMLVGGFEVSLGILLIINASIFVDLVAQFLYIALIVIGALFLIFSILKIARRKDDTSLFMPISEIVFGAILVGLGIAFCIVYYKTNDTQKIKLIILGSILVAIALAQLIITTISLSKIKKKGKDLVVADETPKKKGEPKKEEPKKGEPKPNDEPEVIEAEVSEDPKQIEKK